MALTSPESKVWWNEKVGRAELTWIAIAFLWLVAPRMLPDRAPPMADTSPRIFSAQLHVKEGGL